MTIIISDYPFPAVEPQRHAGFSHWYDSPSLRADAPPPGQFSFQPQACVWPFYGFCQTMGVKEEGGRGGTSNHLFGFCCRSLSEATLLFRRNPEVKLLQSSDRLLGLWKVETFSASWSQRIWSLILILSAGFLVKLHMVLGFERLKYLEGHFLPDWGNGDRKCVGGG